MCPDMRKITELSSDDDSIAQAHNDGREDSAEQHNATRSSRKESHPSESEDPFIPRCPFLQEMTNGLGRSNMRKMTLRSFRYGRYFPQEICRYDDDDSYRQLPYTITS